MLIWQYRGTGWCTLCVCVHARACVCQIGDLKKSSKLTTLNANNMLTPSLQQCQSLQRFLVWASYRCNQQFPCPQIRTLCQWYWNHCCSHKLLRVLDNWQPPEKNGFVQCKLHREKENSSVSVSWIAWEYQRVLCTCSLWCRTSLICMIDRLKCVICKKK